MPTPVSTPVAPKGWRPNRDQMARVAQDPRLHKLSNDELYLFFGQANAKPKGNFLSELMRKVGVPKNWQEQAFSWHPKSTIGRAAGALRDANERNER